MARIEPTLLPVVADLERGLRELGVPFGIVGALVPELLLDARPARMTNDADVMVIVQTLAEFETLKDQLAGYRFERTRLAHRLRHTSGGLLDILPYSESIAPGDRLQLDVDRVFNMAGFRHVVPQAVPTAIEDGPTLPLAPLPLYALLKLVAFSDRRAPKDLGGVLHCLEHYLEDDERRYGVEFDGAGVPYDYTCAHLLGLDARPLLDESISQTIRGVLDLFDEPDAQVVGIAVGERGRAWVDDDRRGHVFELFRWYRRGTGL
jgi:predicted nucleotidyltransferase